LSRKTRPPRAVREASPTVPVIEKETPEAAQAANKVGSRSLVALAVVLMLGLHAGLAVNSLLQENATVDEALHMPAGISYWQKGTFRLYHQNPPLVKLVAALPVVLSHPKTEKLYGMPAWEQESQAVFGQYFARENFENYFELFDLARLMMPLFTVIGGLVVFAWSSRLYGAGGGLLSLALWCLCPNILAHGRLITSDMAAASLGAGATYLFWRSLKNPAWGRVVLAGLALGLAELTKFSMILLYGLWPALAVVRFLLERRWSGWPRRLASGFVQFVAMVVLSVLVIDAGYAYEGVGIPLGKFEFVSRSLTRPVSHGMVRPPSKNQLLDSAWRYRINRFRGTVLGSIPVPLPKHYLLGFDEQKIETEGIPKYFLDERWPHDDSVTGGYPVYLNGTLQDHGWWYYYLATLAYKVPEGTLFLVALSGFVLVGSKRSRAPWADEFAVLSTAVVVLLAMSFLTDICLGLRYILPIFPYLFIGVGKLVPWASGLAGWKKRAGWGLIGGALLATSAATASIHPDYLAYFNWVSGGPDRGAEHLIDSNLDWGQDLVKLNRWLKREHPGRRVGLACFGQINPAIFKLRGDGFDWFLPPALPGTISAVGDPAYLDGPAPRLTPGLYAVSASIVKGLPWRFYDSRSLKYPELIWLGAWRTLENPETHDDAFGYFRELTPVARVGHSIYVYEVSAEDCRRLAPRWTGAKIEKMAD
jgi:Dolichyl-phosphate-mannose-protein mannosyltransferase